LLAVAASGLASAGRAQDGSRAPDRDWPRFYVGVALGNSDVSHSLSEVGGIPEQAWGDLSVESNTGKKVLAGFRPLRLLGVELQYVDFGDGDRSSDTGGQVPIQAVSLESDTEAAVLAALLYIPEPMPSFDLYGKVGVADVDDSFTVSGYDRELPFCRGPPFPVPSDCDFNIEAGESGSAPYVGFGARLKVAAAVGIRFEAEAIDRDEDDNLTMLSLGIAWEF
jgi:hypothetical protein